MQDTFFLELYSLFGAPGGLTASYPIFCGQRPAGSVPELGILCLAIYA